MAKMHARRRGRSASSKPLVTENPEWVPMPKEEVEQTVVKLAKEGMTASKIGMVLRDQYAVPSVRLATGKTMYEILEQNGVRPALPDDLVALMRRAINVNLHLTENKKDMANNRNLQLIESKIRRLVKYYKRHDILPQEWEYSLKNAELLIE
ncbi:MAG TPA: 30S ribosomal protein S15 [Methanomassiliicoccales archaeon]|jgi:small subunit ribosomal protein S15|nr:30S ribosomal protein S15 [Methanomassiliicoccales archaeon]